MDCYLQAFFISNGIIPGRVARYSSVCLYIHSCFELRVLLHLLIVSYDGFYRVVSCCVVLCLAAV